MYVIRGCEFNIMELLTVGYHYNFDCTDIVSIYLTDSKINFKHQIYRKLNIETAIEQLSVYRSKLSKKQVNTIDNQLIYSRLGHTINFHQIKNLEDYDALLESLKQSNKCYPYTITSSNYKLALLLALAGLDVKRIFGDDDGYVCIGTVVPRKTYFGNKKGYVSRRNKRVNFGRFI